MKATTCTFALYLLQRLQEASASGFILIALYGCYRHQLTTDERRSLAARNHSSGGTPLDVAVCLRSALPSTGGLDILTANGCPYGSGRLDNVEFVDRGAGHKCMIRVPFTFAWPERFAGVVEMRRGDAPVWRSVKAWKLRPGARQHYEQASGNASALAQYAYTVELHCDQHYYGLDCATFCKAAHGGVTGAHYTCDPSAGMRVCAAGYSGALCDEPVCARPCLNGATCAAPDTCQCAFGWRGEWCERCATLAGCVHGDCTMPGECLCAGRWGGAFCDMDLDVCQHRAPCNTATSLACIPGPPCAPSRRLCEYTCVCRAGYEGKRCDVETRLANETDSHRAANGQAVGPNSAQSNTRLAVLCVAITAASLLALSAGAVYWWYTKQRSDTDGPICCSAAASGLLPFKVSFALNLYCGRQWEETAAAATTDGKERRCRCALHNADGVDGGGGCACAPPPSYRQCVQMEEDERDETADGDGRRGAAADSIECKVATV